MNGNRAMAYLKFVCAMLVFGTIGIFRRYIPLSSSLLAFSRGVLGASFLCFFVKIRGKSLRNGIGWKNVFLLIVSGAMIGVNWILLFESYNFTSVATATLCYYMEPTIVILCSPLFFREKLTKKKGICALAALIGMVLVSGIAESGGLSANDPKGILFGLGAAAFYACVVMLNKKIHVEDAYEKTTIQLASASTVLLPYLILTSAFSDVQVTPISVVMILIVGIVHTGISYAMYFGSMQEMKSQSIAVLSYIDPVSALILSALILGESLTVPGMVGAVLIIGSALISELPVGEPKEKKIPEE